LAAAGLFAAALIFASKSISEQSSAGAVVARMYPFGMEEEYFVYDARTRHAVCRANKKFLSRAQKQLGDRVMTEMLQS